MKFDKILPALLFFTAATLISVQADISIGQGPSIGTDKRGTVWYEEFQDWVVGDLRALDPNSDQYLFNETPDPARDLIAFYSREENGNYYFRADFFALGFGEENSEVDLYFAIDCASGGEVWLPDFMDAQTDHPWEICIAVYNGTAGTVYSRADGDSWDNDTTGNFLGSYWRSDLDAVEFGIPRQTLLDAGWNGTSPLHFQIFTARDGTDSGAGEINDGTYTADIVDTISASLNTSVSPNILNGGISSTSTWSGRAKYAMVAHANQSLNKVDGTQNHIYTDRSDLDPNPTGGLHPGFIRTLDTHEMLNVPLNMHISGSLISSFLWAKQNPAESNYPDRDGPTFLERCVAHATTGPGSLIGGVFAEHIMPYFEGEPNVSSINMFNEMAQNVFGLSASDMRVMHIPERVFHADTTAAWTDAGNTYLKGNPFQDILDGGYEAAYLDEITHLHWWFYPNEADAGSPHGGSWDENNCGRWAGGSGNDEAPYQHKIHKINGVHCFMINDREDQSKFGNDDSGMMNDTRYTLLNKALNTLDQSQITLVFDDWEALAGNSFASDTPNNNADQWHNTIRWAANHPWIEIVNLKDIFDRATNLANPQYDGNWVIDQGTGNTDKTLQTYEWLKRASEHTYDNWYFGSALEQTFRDAQPTVSPNNGGEVPTGMKIYGDLETPGTLIRDAWEAVKAIPAGKNLRKLAELTYAAMIYETAWHDEDANPDQYQSRNYQATFDRVDACTTSSEDTTHDPTSNWALKLHGHIRNVGMITSAANWALDVESGAQGSTTVALAQDIDDDTLDEYILKNNHAYLIFESWGGRLLYAFQYIGGGDAVAVIGSPVSNPSEEHEGEGANNTRCSSFKDRWNTGHADHRYVDGSYTVTPSADAQGNPAWRFSSWDSSITKIISLENGADIIRADYSLNPFLGHLYLRHGLGANQTDLVFNGQDNLTIDTDNDYYYGLKNNNGGAVYAVRGGNNSFSPTGGGLDQAGWDNRLFATTHQIELYNTSPATVSNNTFSTFLALSQTSADDIDSDGLSNATEQSIGTDHTKPDTDGDGMPDAWENTYAPTLDPTTDDATSDPDGDGVTNLDEYTGGTDPTVGDLFEICSIVLTGNDVTITWTSQPSVSYTIQSSPDLQTWSNIGTKNGALSPATTTDYTDVGGATAVRKFYRIKR